MGVMQKVFRAVAAPVLALALPMTAAAQGLIRDAEIEHLRTFGADVIVSGEQEIALAMINATHLARPA